MEQSRVGEARPSVRWTYAELARLPSEGSERYEVASPPTVGRDRRIKLDRYRHFGVPEYWIVDADDGSVAVWRLGKGAEKAEVARAG